MKLFSKATELTGLCVRQNVIAFNRQHIVTRMFIMSQFLCEVCLKLVQEGETSRADADRLRR
jgi:hypothetical protein